MSYYKLSNVIFIFVILMFFGASIHVTAEEPMKSSSTNRVEIGESYTLERHDDWNIQCVKSPETQIDPCQLYQMLYDQKSNAVAEIHLFIILNNNEIAAGASLMTPLETLLPRNIQLYIDTNPGKEYPFTFCTTLGCVSRIAFTEAEIDKLKQGNFVKAIIYSARNPEVEITATLSLKGFTAALKKLYLITNN